MIDLLSDEHFMKQALVQAEKAASEDEVPVGAVIVCEGRIIARAHKLKHLVTSRPMRSCWPLPQPQIFLEENI